MRQTEFLKLVDKVIELKMRAADKFIKETLEPFGDIGNPEKLIGKKYESWTQEDLMLLGTIYGPEPNELSRFIFKQEYKKLKELEAEGQYGTT